MELTTIIIIIVCLAMVLFIYFVESIQSVEENYVISTDMKGNAFSEKLEKFWESTGFCPLDVEESNFVLTPDEKINIALIGSLPNNAIKQIRIHWLLNLLEKRTGNKSKSHIWDFSKLDELINLLKTYELRPGFELMGIPNSFVNFSKDGSFWKNLVFKIAKRYLKKYGPKYVSQWRFETWNEPDLKMYNVLNFTLPEYLNYINGCRDGLKQAFKNKGKGKQWRLGGPAGTFREKNHPLCWGILQFCDDIPARCPLQYISFHRKGNGTPEGLLNETLYLLDAIEKRFRNLKNLPVANDESDFEVTWSKPLSWRGDVRYAAMMAQAVISYYELVRRQRKLKIELLSYDNGFLNYHPYYFTQRTLLTRFQINITSPAHVQFIKKPAYSVMGLLSYLEEEVFMKKNHGYLTVLGTRSVKREPFVTAVMLIYSNGTTTNTEKTKKVFLNVYELPNCDGKYTVYQLDNINTNPYDIWKRMASPIFPNRSELNVLRKAEGPMRLFSSVTPINGNLTVSFNVSLPTIALLHFGCKPQESPSRVYSLLIYNVTKNEVLMTWKYKNRENRFIKTFIVEFKSDANVGFQRINDEDVIQNSFQYNASEQLTGLTTQISESTRGYYRVKAIDYWDRAGNYSKIIFYP